MKQKLFVTAVLMLGISTVTHASGLQLGLTRNTLSLGLDQNIIGPLGVDAAFVENYENNAKLANAGVHLNAGLGPVGAMVGVKYFYTSVSGQDGHGVAPGVGLSFSPIPLVTLSGQYYYSNTDYSQGDIDHYRDWSATASFHPLKFTNFYVGYGSQSVDTKKYGNTNIFNGVFVGINIGF